MKWLFVTIAGLLAAATVVIAANWEYLYEELVIDPLGETALLAELASAGPSPCQNTEPPPGYIRNYELCYEYHEPDDWVSIVYKRGQYQALSSRQFMDALDSFPDESFTDTSRWDHHWDHTLEIEVHVTLSELTGSTESSAPLTVYLESGQTRYTNLTATTLGDQPAFHATEVLDNEPSHEVILCEYKGKIVLIRIGAGEYDRVNRSNVDRAIQSFRFLPEFGTSK